ncbi:MULTISPECIES: DUF3422 family protein [unclassified Massilia]|uniref:DUF3422 family protein n=1 Tax=unclassified Massilia TaxID=2609279 RepID=UPI0017851C8B|nr:MULTISPECIES: DUF3422 domain-containing protein [unclassified Massilia]MBD8531088.1 DUF3422 domain-containing protein [Massilia sp. CFBP 13647]MBD8674788.1 DUF3422 domain-containing protein [Massilia sp. CFBP 13721]
MRDFNGSLNHPSRVPLAAELHSRPFLRLDAPQAITHLAICHGGPQAQVQHGLLAALCGHFGVAAPASDNTAGSKHFFHDFGSFCLKWECHTEFATYTVAAPLAQGTAPHDAFDHMPLAFLPAAWLSQLEGLLMAAAHVAMVEGGADASRLAAVFERRQLAGSSVMQGAELWTDFAIQADGFSRFVIRDLGMRHLQGGRLVQRVLEIETYRMMALLGLPAARLVGTELDRIEAELAALAGAMVATDMAPADAGGDGEGRLLAQITRLAARLEKLILDNGYRFSASRAYFSIVRARIEELREVRIEGTPTVEEFMDRRLAPAMHTCDATSARQDALGRRLADTNDLLRTRVGIVQEMQNRRILESMNARAAQQLRLQLAVEGLSVAAISYYLVGLLGYAGKAAKAAGLPVNPDLMLGVLVPLVAGAVWLAQRRVHRRIGRSH